MGRERPGSSGWNSEIDDMGGCGHHSAMSEPPLYLLQPLSSIEEQRRYVIGGTVAEYLIPEEIINDAWPFCERAELPMVAANLTETQIASVARLKESINRLSACTERYDRGNISKLIEDDPCWALMRSRAGEVLSAFGCIVEG
jgi:hypothetical protein